MNWWGSGFVPILIYGSFSQSDLEDFTIITETTNLDLLTENGMNLLTESFA